MTWAIAVLVIAVLGVAAAIAAGRVGEMKPEPVHDLYRADLPDHPLTSSDVAELRFGVTLRGYAMEQVDAVLDRLSREISERDELIAQLNGRELGGREDHPGNPVSEGTAGPR
jgi:DivIVA domain-containing protein